MKFTIEVETDEHNTILNSTVITPEGRRVELNKGELPRFDVFDAPGYAWLVMDEVNKKRMISLSQVHY